MGRFISRVRCFGWGGHVICTDPSRNGFICGRCKRRLRWVNWWPGPIVDRRD